MGKIIICNGKQAKTPYYFKLTNTNVYSIEELCYYIYNFIEIINEEIFTDTLMTWIAEELTLEDRANKLNQLILNNAGLKDYVVCVMCSSDYYTELEIKQLLHTIDELSKLTPIDKKIKKANNYLKYKQYTEAATEYENILNGKEFSLLTNTQRGNLLHNLGIVLINTIGVSLASPKFKEAYEYNGNLESLKQYFYTLLLSKNDSMLKQESLRYGIKDELLEEINEKLQQSYKSAEESEEYGCYHTLTEYKKSGKILQFYGLAKEYISGLKQEYRYENS